MTAETEAIAILRVPIYLLIGWIIYFWGYRNFRTALLRHKLFVLRDRLFRETCEQGVSLDNPVYLELRRTINRLLRYAHLFNCGSLFGISRWIKEEDLDLVKWLDQWEEQIEGLENEEYKELVEEISIAVQLKVLLHVFTGSPLLVIQMTYEAIIWVIKALYKRDAKSVLSKTQNLFLKPQIVLSSVLVQALR